MKKLAFSVACATAMVFCLAAEPQLRKAPEWEDPEVNAINRLPARTYSVPLASEADALTDALEPKTPYALSLNGTWKMSWAGNPELRVKDFWKTDFDDRAWHSVDVPGCVELQGFGSPGYTNIRYPHADLSHPTNAAFATIRDRESGKPDYNPVSSYRTKFNVPASWKGRRVILRFDGVYSAYYVWVNGRKVGYAEDSKLPSEFDVTEYLKGTGNREQGTGNREQGTGNGEQENVLAVEVYRWCDGSYLEDQDMTRFSGIFRDVTLWAMPEGGVWDFTVKASADGRLEVKVVDGSKSKGEGEQRISATLYDARKGKVGDLHCSTSTSTFVLDVKGVHLWSAEDPYLYTLVIRRGDDIRMKRIGFKEQRIDGHTFLVNGQKVKFKGVNRHETNPERGRSVTRDDMIRDITLMKRYNINTVRTSHYPDHRLWYELCDRYGIYLVAEANVEGHEPGYGEKGLGLFPAWNRTIVERNARHVTFYRNHPSVTMWSLGNETGHGVCFSNAAAAVRAADPTRPVHWERGNDVADVDSCMYPPVEWLEERGASGDLPPEPGKGLTYWGTKMTQGKCFFLCEYAHAMGNAIGNFAEYWETFYRHDSLCGGCIWDWIDQALWKETDRIDPKTGRRERFLSYGGDFDESPNDGPFNCNGVIDPERHVTAKLVEVGHVHRNLVVTRSEAPGDNGLATVFELWNRFSFTRADEFLGAWKLLEDGKAVANGAFEPPALAPLARCRFTVTGLAEALAKTRQGAELLVDFEFVTKKDFPWAEKGWTVARDQIVLRKKVKVEGEQRMIRPSVEETDEAVVVTAGGTRAVFSRRTGTLSELSLAGRTVLKDPVAGLAAGPRLSFARALTDNDCWMRDGFYASGLSQPRYHARPIEVRDGVVRTAVEVTGSKSAGFTHEATWRFASDGTLVVSNSVIPYGTMPAALPRLGLTLRLEKGLDRVSYYGRGPRENYVDRRTGSFLGVYDASVDDLAEPYVRPQDNGYRTDVRWVAFADAQGRGVRFSASEPLYVQAQHAGWEDFEFARHRNGQQRFRAPVARDGEIRLNLDVRQTGLGGASCGPRPMAKYLFPIERTDWTLCIAPYEAGGGVFVNSDAWNFWLGNGDLATCDREGLIKALYRDVDAYAARGGVRAVFYNMNFQRSFYPTKVGTPIWKDCEIRDGRLFLRGQEVTAANDAAGYVKLIGGAKRMNELVPDFMALRYRRCHEKGMEMWHSMRMNDVHHTGLGQEHRPQHCDLWQERKDLLRAWYRHFERIEREDNCFDYGKREVYDYHLAMVREYLMDYVSDGLELDWGRSGPVFAPGSDEANTPVLTAFMRDVRKIADAAERKWGHRMRIAVRIPNRVSDAYGQGMDIAAWDREGLVDVIMPTSHHHDPEQQCEVALYRRIAPRAILAPCIDYSAGSAPGFSLAFDRDPGYDAGFASGWYQQGADTMYFYNHFPHHFQAKPGADKGLWLAANRDRAAAASRRHIHTRHDPNGEGRFEEACYPRAIWKNSSNGAFKINCGEKVAGRRARVIVGVRKGVTLNVRLRVNTVECRALPEDAPLPPLPKPEKATYRSFEIPSGALHDGWNAVEIHNCDEKTLGPDDFVWTEVTVD